MNLAATSVSDSEIVSEVTNFVAAGFDVTAEVPLRAKLFQIKADEHVLVFVVHHISTDGFSMGPLTRDVMTAYYAPNQRPGSDLDAVAGAVCRLLVVAA